MWNPWCQAGLKRVSDAQSGWKYHRIPSEHSVQLVPETQNSEYRDFQHKYRRGAENSKSTKSKPFLDGPTTRGSKTNIVEYLGIASDEPKRFGQINERKRAPLVEFGIDEDMCGLYCTYADMLSPTYETSYRDGCWFCHNQGVDQLRLLRKNYPDLWALLLKWDKDSPVAFKADGHTVCDFDVRFQMEEENKVPVGRSFRWSMLETPPKFVATTGDQLTIF